MPYSDPEKQREYQRRWVERRKNEWFLNKRCIECGSYENLQIDHIDPNQKVNHRIWSWSKKRRDDELSKCQVLCCYCHLNKSKDENVDRLTKLGPRPESSSKFKGVDWYKKYNKWRATIQFNKKQKHLGCFNSEEEAALAYNKAAVEHWGSECFLNEI